MSDTPIKLPVRYDPKQKVIRDDDFGSVLVTMPQTFAFKEEDVARLDSRGDEVGEYIATAINEHAALRDRVTALRAALLNARNTIVILSEQQAMSDDFWKATVADIDRALYRGEEEKG